MSPNTRRFILPLVYLAIALVAYGPALRGELILDDWGYITRNPWVTTSTSPWIFWNRLDQIDYYPLTYTWYWVAWRLFGEATLPYHLVNVVLHTGVATLVASICRRLIAPAPFWVSALAGLGFLLHPQNVPAVAWIIQSKTLLATFLALAATLLYLRRHEIPAVLAFAAALAAKASVASLPLWLFMVARRERRRPLPILGFLLVAAASAGLATYVNRNSVSKVPPLPYRLIELPLNLVFYLRGFVFPTYTSFVHEMRPLDLGVAASAVFAAAIVAVFVWCYLRRGRLGSIGLAAAWYVIALLPALGIVPSQYMRITPVADHYAYFANVGLIILLAMIPRVRAALAVIVIGWATLTWQYAGAFATEEGIWRHAAERAPRSAFVWYNLGTVLDKKADREGAAGAYRQTLAADPSHTLARYNMAGLAISAGRFAEAESELQLVVARDPRYAPGHANLAYVIRMQGRLSEALAVARTGMLTADPNPDLAVYICRLEAESGQFAAARAACDAALAMAPGHVQAAQVKAALPQN